MNVISIIMPCYNRDFDLLRVLKAYDQQDAPFSFEVIAVDDASSDKTFALLTSYRPQKYSLKVFRQPSNQGPAAARNRGIGEASAPLILFVGDDILPSPTFVKEHVSAHQRCDTRTAILGYTTWPADITLNSLMSHIDGIGAQQFSYYYLRSGQKYDFRHFYTSNISIKTEFLKSLDYWFDTDFIYAAFEDAELAYRLAKKGLKIIYQAEPVAYHYHYHTAWTFSRRQFLAGLMACVLVKKHPELFPMIIGRNRKLQFALWRLQGIVQPTKVDLNAHEMQAISRASACEFFPQDKMITIYQHLLDYFYTKGIIFGTFPEKIALQISKVYARQKLRLILD
ncbi:MAG: hypothetical protein OHK0031_04460 [Anaerolineales bacterium]